jgi:hypothetical protein
MLEAAEEAIDAGRVVSSHGSDYRPTARPWIPGIDQPMSLASGATFSTVTFEHRYTKLQHIVFSQKQEGVGDEAARISFREPGVRLEILSLFKLNFLISFFFIFAPECGIIAYKFCSVSKIYPLGGSA